MKPVILPVALALAVILPAQAQQPDVRNARLQTQSVQGGLDMTFRSLVRAQDSPGWIEAQAALARLDDAQSPFAFLRSSLERLAADRTTAGQPPYPALDQAIAEAGARSDQVRARAATIEAALKS